MDFLKRLRPVSWQRAGHTFKGRRMRMKCSIKKGQCAKLNGWYGYNEGYTYMLADMIYCPFCDKKIKKR